MAGRSGKSRTAPAPTARVEDSETLPFELAGLNIVPPAPKRHGRKAP